MFSKKFLYLQIVFFLLLLAGGYLYYREHNPPPLPILGQVHDFKLTGIDGQDVRLADLQGKFWIADFMFTTCGSICPVMTKNMNVLHRAFHSYEDVKLVSISVNPENDTPQVMKQYAYKYRADPRQWFFLTGSREEITKLAVLSFKMGDMKEPVFHSPNFALVDRKAQIRGYYDGTKPENIKKLAEDLSRLLKEKQ